MSELKKSMDPTVTKEVDEQKREFMKKFGSYAAAAPLGMYLLMGPGASKAQASAFVSTCYRPADGSAEKITGYGHSPVYQNGKIVKLDLSSDSEHAPVKKGTIVVDYANQRVKVFKQEGSTTEVYRDFSFADIAYAKDHNPPIDYEWSVYRMLNAHGFTL